MFGNGDEIERAMQHAPQFLLQIVIQHESWLFSLSDSLISKAPIDIKIAPGINPLLKDSLKIKAIIIDEPTGIKFARAAFWYELPFFIAISHK